MYRLFFIDCPAGMASYCTRVLKGDNILVKRRAVYPGSFDPITNGHLDIMRRASRIFDELIVAVAEHPLKQTLFSQEERYQLICDACRALPNVEVDCFTGLLMDFARRRKAKVLIRGLRAVTDFEYEFSMALMNKHLEPEVETVFLATSADNSFVSSSLIKEVFKLGGDVNDKVPACVLQALQKKLG